MCIDFTTFDIIGDMAFGRPFGCLREAGAFEQATRRMFQINSWPQRMLVKLIPSTLREKRYRHLELSREKCLQ